MNVLWIEDFGGGLKADSATVINLFRGLIPARIFDDEWGPETDLLSDPGELSRFSLAHSAEHRVDLMRHYADFLATQVDFNTEYDAVAIDINLSRGLPRDIPLPQGQSDVEGFHKKAGFYIYNRLIQAGFPAEHICFLTGEKESTFGEFSEQCRQAMMPLPTAFGKDFAGLEEFRIWLDGRRRSTYTILRRGVIEGCRMVRSMLDGRADAIQFNVFLEDGEVTPGGMDDYLSALASFLPAREPVAVELNRVLRLFSRAIAHEWESNAKPSNIRPNGDKHLIALRTFGQVMKNTRNWLAHGRSLNALTVETATYIFLINLRAMFRIPPETQRHEYILLTVFGPPIPSLNSETISTRLTENYQSLVQAYIQAGGDKLAWRFNEIANNMENLGLAGVDYVQALYQVLWHQLAQRENRDSAAVYKCDCRTSSFTTTGRSDNFLNLFLRHLYTHSFS